MGKNFSLSEYVAVGTIFNLREAFHCAFNNVNLTIICNEQGFHSINLSNVHFFIASQGSTRLVKIFLNCHENFGHTQQKNNQTQAELVFSSETDKQKNNIEDGGE